MKHLSLEVCKQLKEAGFPQETEFMWMDCKHDTGNTIEIKLRECLVLYTNLTPICACPMVEEILEQLTPEQKLRKSPVYCVQTGKWESVGRDTQSPSLTEYWAKVVLEVGK
mgnify:CR=1 FL=1